MAEQEHGSMDRTDARRRRAQPAGSTEIDRPASGPDDARGILPRDLALTLRAQQHAPPGAQVGRLIAQRAMALQRTHGNSYVQRLMNPASAIARSTSAISETTDTGNTYTQELVLNKKMARISVRLGVNWVKQGTWADSKSYAAFIRKVKTAVYGYMDHKFKVVCTPRASGAGPAPVELPIDFLIYDMSSGYTIEAHGGTPGGDSFMSESGGEVYEYGSDDSPEEAITYAHEFGHAMLGASDEYVNPAVPGRVLSNDHSIMANYYTQGIDEAEFKARHFQHIVTEVAKAFAGYTCTIEEM